VKCPLKLKKYLSIQYQVRHRTTILQYPDRWNQHLVCSKNKDGVDGDLGVAREYYGSRGHKDYVVFYTCNVVMKFRSCSISLQTDRSPVIYLPGLWSILPLKWRQHVDAHTIWCLHLSNYRFLWPIWNFVVVITSNIKFGWRHFFVSMKREIRLRQHELLLLISMHEHS